MIRISSYSLKKLKVKFENCEFAIPEIQRMYVWNKPRVVKLMDSIYRHYPIGISLVWVAPFSKAIHIRPNNKSIIPPFNKRLKQAELIIDGQQRLSTIYSVLFGIEDRKEANSLINFQELYFVLDKKAENRFVFSKRFDEHTDGYVKLNLLLNTRPSVLKTRKKLNQVEFREVIKCYKAFHSYDFYLLKFLGRDFDDIREIFIRINSAGMNVSRADTIFAKASDVNLRDHILDTRRGLKHSYDLIGIDALQSALALAYGSSQISGKAFEVFYKKIEKGKNASLEFNKIWKKLQYGYEEAVDFLVNHLKVRRPNLLPSQNIYSMLSYFFYLNQSRGTTKQIKEIKKWFWHTACGERYSGASFNRNIPEDIKFFSRLANNSNAKYTIVEKINPLDFLRTDYRRPSSSSNAYLIYLRIKKPLYLLNGHEILLDDATSISNRKDRHHIYPYAMLKRRAITVKWINSITNICYLESDENQSISDTIPGKYLAGYKKLSHFGRVMKSHAIPFTINSPVWDNHIKQSYLQFINERGRIILNEIEILAGAKIFGVFDRIKRI